MDLRLMLDGGAAPPAPPGKGTEPPPPPDEFEKTLQQAKGGDETPGEVADTEPNAQLQKLDSKDSDKKGTGKEIPVGVLIDQAVTIPVQLLNAPQLAIAPAPGTAPKTDKTSPSISPISTVGKTAPVDPAPAQQILPVATTVSSDATDPVGTKDVPFDMAQLVSSMVTNGQLRNLAANPKSAVINGSSPMPVDSRGTAKTAPTGPMPAEKVETPLNITSIQTTSNAALTEATAAPVVSVTPVAQTIGKAASLDKGDVKKADGVKIDQKLESKGIKAGKAEVTLGDAKAEAEVSNQLGQGKGDGDSKSDAQKDAQADVQVMVAKDAAAPTKTAEAAPVQSPTNGLQLTTAERQRVVDTLTKRIEEMSANSVRNEVRVEMQPPDLGSVVVNIRKDVEGLTATLSASNEPLRQALHESRNDLAGALADRSVGQVKVEVRSASADTMNMGQQFSQAQSQNSQQQQQQPRYAAVNHRMAQNGTRESSAEVKPEPRRASTTLLDLEI
ncbi:MAG: flagellar hook-length control protein FliK [Armatimonadetes bacterium]|nr:flagellar hook-length control protein FliK [Armatimonadota bacterium]